jgi:hypothetical protein
MQRIVFGAAMGSTFVVVMLSGCVGDDPVSSSPSSDGGPTGPGTVTDSGGVVDLAPDAAPSAQCPRNCLPPAPAGWQGPEATYDGAEQGKPANCPSVYTQKVLEAHRGMTAKTPECGCGTPSFQGAVCTATAGVWGDSVCDPNQIYQTVGDVSSAGPCLLVSVNNTKGLYVDIGSVTTRGTCSFPSPVKNIEPLKFEGVELACALPTVTACEGRADCISSPIPEAPFTRLCIHRDGEHQCPSADYSVKVLAKKALTDTRACTDCTNPTTAGGSCGAKWGIASQAACSGAIPTTYDSGKSCTNYTPGVYVDVRGMAPVGITCTSATGGKPTGEATSTGDITFCCDR